MARLETQINQIYSLPSDGKQVSLILHDELLNNNNHLFIIADLVKIEKKTEASELKKIFEIILQTFQSNKKLTGENLFESSLALINQKLADFAHDGKKSWLGKFSSLVVLKSSDNIYLAGSGAMVAMLYRDSAFVEILGSEKRGIHPLKTFSNFTAGKLKPADILLLSTANLFSYIALENLSKMMTEGDASKVSEKASKILQDTKNSDEGFASFFVSFSKPTVVAAEPKPAIMSEPTPEKSPLAAVPAATMLAPEDEIYAPLPEQMSPPETIKSTESKIFSRLPKVALPKFRIPLPKFKFLEHLSPWAKFFLISFLIFLILFASNIVAYTIRKHHKQTQDQTSTTISSLIKNMNDAESALIYRNQDQAVKLLSDAQADLNKLKDLNSSAYNQYAPSFADLANKINHITVVSSPKVLLTLKHPATDMTRAGSGFVIADSSSGTITTYNTGSADATGKELFLLNKIGEIKGIAHIPNVGHIAITSSEMYLINTTQSQFDLLHIYPKTDFNRLKLIAPDRLYTLDEKSNQVLRITFSKQNQIAPVNLLKNANLAGAQDIAVDTDVYVLKNNALEKYTNGTLTSFKLQQPSDQIMAANRVFTASNIYILESAKKRLLIYNKQGVLQTQIFFPSSTDLRDLYVDENQRTIYLLDSSQILSVTF